MFLGMVDLRCLFSVAGFVGRGDMEALKKETCILLNRVRGSPLLITERKNFNHKRPKLIMKLIRKLV